jgi:hypothetical protein
MNERFKLSEISNEHINLLMQIEKYIKKCQLSN